MQYGKEDFLGMVDHSILRPETTVEEVVREALEVAEAGVFSVCVKPSDVRAVANALEGHSTEVGTVIGFPHGNSTVEVKILEALTAVQEGAVEVDVVANFARLIGTEKDMMGEVEDIQKFCDALSSEFPHRDICVKVIIETAYFPEDRLAAVASALAGTDVDFLKTSTGFAHEGATVETVSILKQHGEPKLVKASGGVRSAEDAVQFVKAGATRLGCSSTLKVAEEF